MSLCGFKQRPGLRRGDGWRNPEPSSLLAARSPCWGRGGGHSSDPLPPPGSSQLHGGRAAERSAWREAGSARRAALGEPGLQKSGVPRRIPELQEPKFPTRRIPELQEPNSPRSGPLAAPRGALPRAKVPPLPPELQEENIPAPRTSSISRSPFPGPGPLAAPEEQLPTRGLWELRPACAAPRAPRLEPRAARGGSRSSAAAHRTETRRPAASAPSGEQRRQCKVLQRQRELPQQQQRELLQQQCKLLQPQCKPQQPRGAPCRQSERRCRTHFFPPPRVAPQHSGRPFLSGKAPPSSPHFRGVGSQPRRGVEVGTKGSPVGSELGFAALRCSVVLRGGALPPCAAIGEQSLWGCWRCALWGPAVAPTKLSLFCPHPSVPPLGCGVAAWPQRRGGNLQSGAGMSKCAVPMGGGLEGAAAF
ncbi:carbohydrate-responsive element-binding protein-like [Tympanuchus pallidicinctus]|uniref:carbohydrate-responsive element-binding protein-like n=1 Tax=Tympanuchus pallidicinctus TaxID=109042 RepID=UPI002287009F|nr:carbohydrate-responsive element-binding protein-like [Tympanuchus pallidicinctus]